MKPFVSRSAFLLAAALLVPACDPGDTIILNSSLPDLYTFTVDVRRGNDTNVGTSAFPFKTIGRALRVALPGETVKVLPGVYDKFSGESFPLYVPAQVELLGDEAAKGAGSPATIIRGGSGDLGFGGSITVQPQAGSLVAGFAIENDTPPITGLGNVSAVFLGAAGIRLRNNTFTNTAVGENSDDAALVFGFGGDSAVLTGNVIEGNPFAGVALFGGGAGSRFEGNVLRQNGSAGLRVILTGGDVDLGGGATGSPGLNTFSCNATFDIEIWNPPFNNVLFARNNFWDHVPPGGNDISNPGAATVDTTGAQLAPNPCP